MNNYSSVFAFDPPTQNSLYIYIQYVCISYIPLPRMISLLLHKSKAESRSSVITASVIGYNWLLSQIGNYIITSCLVNKRVGDNYC